MPNAIAVEVIAAKIFELRGKKVILDMDLAKLYGVSAKVLNQAVKRNINRFPEDFMFQLSWEEVKSLRSQFVTLNNAKPETTRRGRHIKYLPYAFTQEGVAMLSSVLNSERAVQVNIQIMRAFVKLQYILSANKQFGMKLRELEDKDGIHDKDIRDIFEAIRQLIGIPNVKRKIKGFTQK